MGSIPVECSCNKIYQRTVYMYKFLVVFAVLLLSLAVAIPAFGHVSSYNPDDSDNGVYTVYVPDSLEVDWAEYREVANRKLDADAPNAPTMQRVNIKENAELWVHKDSTLTGCFGFAESYVGAQDEVHVAPNCPDYMGLFSHEIGHTYGLPGGTGHHDCTAYWKDRTVNVGDTTPDDGITQGCAVTQRGFGPHDLTAFADKAWN